MSSLLRSQKQVKRGFSSGVPREQVAIDPVSMRTQTRLWSEAISADRRQPAVQAFMITAVEAFVASRNLAAPPVLPQFSMSLSYVLDPASAEFARMIGEAVAGLTVEQACFDLSSCYSGMLPQDLRSAWGAYYTPPALSDRLLSLATSAGVRWTDASVLDPACGGGAFLLPAALRIRDARPDLGGAALLRHFECHLKGLDVDPFAAWLTQAWLTVAFASDLAMSGAEFPTVVEVGDSLMGEPSERYDLVIGNPPYGRVTLDKSLRERYRRSLFGHANLYGLFTDLALRWTRPGGIIAYVTPTSFLAGEYFKALRGLISDQAPPIAMDLVTERRGVFDDVLQETMLTVYEKDGEPRDVDIHFLSVNGKAEVTRTGHFTLPVDSSVPWLVPRVPSDNQLVAVLSRMPSRLCDWGYTVSTGPLVWNRHKPQFRSAKTRGTRPVIWAESVSSAGEFQFRSEKRNHLPYFLPGPADDWLMIRSGCVLLQRTTAKEQNRRLIAAELPQSFVDAHSAVIVENHLNMIRPTSTTPNVSPAALTAVLNSRIVDRAFRCISGSVAVSAFELEALPLPSAKSLRTVEALVISGASADLIDAEVARLYGVE